ncbi:MAG TPA: Uma2 family endonuclease [Allosphingosinicella sp.]|nr:Uma2 family endonuclease [Allosphingosinicella sp.]
MTPGQRIYLPLDAVALVVEVSDASIAFDLGDKAVLYARHGDLEYWVLDLNTAQLHQFWTPRETGYGEARSVDLGGRIESITIPGHGVESGGLV